jgi:hypothetical protein
MFVPLIEIKVIHALVLELALETQGEGDGSYSRAGDPIGNLGVGDLGLDLLQQERRLIDTTDLS